MYTAVADPDLQIRGAGGVGHPEPGIRGEPGQFGLKIRGVPRAPPLDPLLHGLLVMSDNKYCVLAAVWFKWHL